jgi:plastocyanin
MKEGRSMRRSIPFAAALLVLVLAASPVAGATRVIKMNSSEDYVPARVTVARGDSVRWKNIATSYLDHDVYGTAPNGYFASPGGAGGMEPGESYTFLFRAAGRYPFLCRVHDGMTGRVTVPLSVATVSAGIKVTVASASQSGYRVRVQRKKGTSGSWSTAGTTTAKSLTWDPPTRGTFYFRARLERTASGASSDWSPTKGITW